jgi:hypothetical protein
MTEFPRLKTGAVLQYPAEREIAYSTQVFRFVDGSEQRCRERGNARRRWIIRLDELDESELAEIEEFFVAQQGRVGEFAFTDPWDGHQYLSCSIEQDELTLSFVEANRGQTILVIRENVG